MSARGSRPAPKGFSKSSPRSLDFLRTRRAVGWSRSARAHRASGMEPASGLRLDRASLEHSENGRFLPAGVPRYSRKTTRNWR